MILNPYLRWTVFLLIIAYNVLAYFSMGSTHPYQLFPLGAFMLLLLGILLYPSVCRSPKQRVWVRLTALAALLISSGIFYYYLSKW